MPKTHPRIEAYGTVDELNAFIACLLEDTGNREDREFLLRIQYNLFTLSSYLATESEDKNSSLPTAEIDLLEQEIDKFDALVPPMKHFVLPGGCKSNAWAHVCRTICRRAERNIYRIIEQGEFVDAMVLQYINRLSDYFFLFSREQSFISNIEEIIWEKPC